MLLLSNESRGDIIIYNFAEMMANCVGNDLRKFREKISNRTENNDICMMEFLLAHAVAYLSDLTISQVGRSCLCFRVDASVHI